MSNPLENFQGEVKIVNAHPNIIKAVQTQLKLVKLYQGEINGIFNPETLKAFTKFKALEYLENPEILGQSTALALLEAVRTHPVPKDEPSKHNDEVVARLPMIGIVSSNNPVYRGSKFTWGELTKNLSRVPENITVTKNLIVLAQHLDLARVRLGNRPITITSAYRPPAVNKAVGGVMTSRHLYGDAADIVVQGLSPREVYRRLESWHGNRGGLGDSVGFTHIDLRGYAARWDYGNA